MNFPKVSQMGGFLGFDGVTGAGSNWGLTLAGRPMYPPSNWGARGGRQNTRKASRKNRKNSRKTSRKASRKAQRKHRNSRKN